MNRTLLAAALLGALSGAASAQSSVTIFGVLDLSLRYVDNDSAGSLSSVSTDGLQGSRIGFRGVEDLGGGLKAGFWLEAGLNPDNGTSNAKFWNRRSTVMLSHNTLGELRLGRDYTATFWNLSTFDPFGPSGIGTSTNLFPAAVSSQPVQTLVRADNVVGYYLPATLGGVYGQVQYAFGEGDGNNKYAGGRIGYAAGPLDVAVAYGQTWTNTPEKLTTLDAGATWDFGGFKLFSEYADLKYAQWSRKNYVIGAAVNVWAGVIRTSYAHSAFDGPACPAAVMTCDDATMFNVGYVYNLSKRTAVYTTAAFIDNGDRAAIALPGGPPGMKVGERSTGFEAGIRHNF